MKGSKLRCMFYCIYKYYIYIIDWLIKYICEWKQMLLYTHHHCLTHSQMIGWQLISSVTSDIIMSILPMQNQPRMSMFFNFLIVFFLIINNWFLPLFFGLKTLVKMLLYNTDVVMLVRLNIKKKICCFNFASLASEFILIIFYAQFCWIYCIRKLKNEY